MTIKLRTHVDKGILVQYFKRKLRGFLCKTCQTVCKLYF